MFTDRSASQWYHLSAANVCKLSNPLKMSDYIYKIMQKMREISGKVYTSTFRTHRPLILVPLKQSDKTGALIGSLSFHRNRTGGCHSDECNSVLDYRD